MFSLHKAIAPTLITTLLVMGSACKRSEHALRLNPNVLDSYVGQYEPDSNTLVTVSREDAHLTFQVNHQASLAIFPETEDTFVHKESGTRFTFTKDATGRVTHLLLDRNGQKSKARRMSQSPAEDQTETVLIGDSKTLFLMSGAGQPTVILWSGIDSWSKIRHGLPTSVRVVSFDRVNTNATAPKPGLSTPSEAARELHAALEQAQLSPPYVLVGHSFGGALVRVFANTYPKEVAGIVLVDPFQEQFVDWLKAHQPGNYDQFVNRGRQSYVSDWEGTLSELRSASSFSDIPVTLLSATNRKPQNGDAIEQGIGSTEFADGSEAITSSQSAWLSKIPHGKLIKVQGGSHNIPGERPEVVVQAVMEIIQQINNSKR